MSSKQSQKGSRFEYKIRDMLTEKTGVKWDRVPMSGAGSMKGDLYCLTTHYYHCFECKSFKDTVIQENLLSAKSNNIYMWWEQCVREAKEMNRLPALVFKKDRGKPLILVEDKIQNINRLDFSVDLGVPVEASLYLFEDWLAVKSIKGVDFSMKGLLELDEVVNAPALENLMLVDCLNFAFRYKHRGDTDFAASYLSTIDSLAKSYGAKQVVLLADSKYSKFRKDKYPNYKIGRKEKYKDQTEEDKEQVKLFFEGYEKALKLATMKYPLLRFEFVEADDLAAYVVQELTPYYEHVWLVSTDGDWDLLLDDKVSRFSFKTRKEYDLFNFYDQHGCDTPEQLLSVKVIMGDKKDSVDGINGIGVKRAYGLAREYGDAYGLVDAIPLPGQQILTKRINEAEQLIYTNYELLDLKSFCADAIAYPDNNNLRVIEEFCDKYRSK